LSNILASLYFPPFILFFSCYLSFLFQLFYTDFVLT
jgi:hypothetical protein